MVYCYHDYTGKPHPAEIPNFQPRCSAITDPFISTVCFPQIPMQYINVHIINQVWHNFHARQSAVQLSVNCNVFYHKQRHAMKTAAKCLKSIDIRMESRGGVATSPVKQNTNKITPSKNKNYWSKNYFQNSMMSPPSTNVNKVETIFIQAELNSENKNLEMAGHVKY